MKARVEEKKQSGKTSSYVLNLDAEWGFGKTFFLDRFSNQLHNRGHLVVQVNAWEDDHADDPLLAVLAEIDKTIEQSLPENTAKQKAWEDIKERVGKISMAVAKGSAFQLANSIGMGIILENLFDAAKEKNSDNYTSKTSNIINHFLESKSDIKHFKSKFKIFIENYLQNDLPVFILIDELDRCRPPFAISMLERVKHISDIDDIVLL